MSVFINSNKKRKIILAPLHDFFLKTCEIPRVLLTMEFEVFFKEK